LNQYLIILFAKLLRATGGSKMIGGSLRQDALSNHFKMEEAFH